jgi:hypothetical protein
MPYPTLGTTRGMSSGTAMNPKSSISSAETTLPAGSTPCACNAQICTSHTLQVTGNIEAIWIIKS